MDEPFGEHLRQCLFDFFTQNGQAGFENQFRGKGKRSFLTGVLELYLRQVVMHENGSQLLDKSNRNDYYLSM
ncbi:hypothetical protein NIE88_17915 [Sporolactobacillus shoreicorticis]|uniref:Uncharacterized protein n=1 Tax=Sporolactobacillus shoreicorticis TaxID=1923877 RepID=A0ABW5RYU7_9BACL|nr:hypothetical protein [Sporolactobacillus shoreicorticis]MCO7127624.1 hypothetical protein [Sporolactobacillus shoreicorticis]